MPNDRPRPPRKARVAIAAAALLGGVVLFGRAAADDAPVGPKPVAVAQAAAPATPPAPAAAEPAVPAEPVVVTRVYDIADLLQPIPSFAEAPTYNRAGGGTGDGRGRFGSDDRDAAARDREQRVANLERTIQEIISPDSWREAGGSAGSLKELEGSLIVMQTEANHQKLADLLDELRDRVPPVRVRAHWVLADRDAVEAVLKPVSLPTARRGATTRPAGGGLLAADVAALTKLPAAVAHFRGELLMMSGQRAYVLATENRPVTTDLEANTGQSVSSYDPTIEEIGKGLLLDVLPALSNDRRTVQMTLRNQWKDLRVEPHNGVTVHATGATQPSQMFSTSTDRYVDRVQELSTTVRIPVGTMVLAGGMTVDPVSPAIVPSEPNGAPAATQPAGDGKPKPQLYLFVEVTPG